MALDDAPWMSELYLIALRRKLRRLMPLHQSARQLQGLCRRLDSRLALGLTGKRISICTLGSAEPEVIAKSAIKYRMYVFTYALLPPSYYSSNKASS
jgi:hypothetical protein